MVLHHIRRFGPYFVPPASHILIINHTVTPQYWLPGLQPPPPLELHVYVREAR